MTRWQAWDARLRQPGPWHTRFDRPDGSKEVTWGRLSPRDGLGDHKLADLIYLAGDVVRAHRDATVVLTEGERAADAVRDAGYLAAGTVCGASSTPGAAVLGLLQDRHLVLWPDRDVVGAAHMGRIAGDLEGLGVRSLRYVDWPEAPEHGDAVDADPETIGRLIAGARLLPLVGPPLCARCGDAVAA